jgi:hypothetical protein
MQSTRTLLCVASFEELAILALDGLVFSKSEFGILAVSIYRIVYRLINLINFDPGLFGLLK